MVTEALSSAPASAAAPTSSDKPASTTPGATLDAGARPPYIFEDGLRRVAPYFFTYKTWCKERWRGRRLIDVFESEFRDRPLEYYRNGMQAGAVTVNGKAVGPEHILKNGDQVSHALHRHEPPVTADPIRALHEDDDMVVINKPAGVPVHPAGRYNYNTVMEIMRAEWGPNFSPFPCNRLDRLTSGIMFVAKNPRAAERLSKQILQRGVRKEYIARVVGKFPDGDVVCDKPILQIAPKVGLNRVRASGKEARSVFRRLAYYCGPPEEQTASAPPTDGASSSPAAASASADRPWTVKQGYSIVRCFPVTGRTHQLRVHLQFLGHPIENDPIYANRRVWGIDLGYNDADASQNSDEDVISRLSRMGKDEVAEAVAYYDEMVDDYHKKTAEKLSGEVCDVCATPLYYDPSPQELSLWLHSRRYEDEDGAWSYHTPLPRWALPPPGSTGPTEVDDPVEVVNAIAAQSGDSTLSAEIAP